MHETAAAPSWVMLAYLVAGVCFILALRGLSSPETSRTGNRVGMLGMAVAVVTTLALHEIAALWEIGLAILIGGAIGFVIARRIAMTAMPQLVAAFHSLVGLAAVLVAAGLLADPEAPVSARELAAFRGRERYWIDDWERFAGAIRLSRFQLDGDELGPRRLEARRRAPTRRHPRSDSEPPKDLRQDHNQRHR